MRESEKGNERGEGERVVGSVVFARHGNKSRKGHSEQKMMHNAPLSQFFLVPGSNFVAYDANILVLLP